MFFLSVLVTPRQLNNAKRIIRSNTVFNMIKISLQQNSQLRSMWIPLFIDSEMQSMRFVCVLSYIAHSVKLLSKHFRPKNAAVTFKATFVTEAQDE
jgi:hypothetical protein